MLFRCVNTGRAERAGSLSEQFSRNFASISPQRSNSSTPTLTTKASWSSTSEPPASLTASSTTRQTAPKPPAAPLTSEVSMMFHAAVDARLDDVADVFYDGVDLIGGQLVFECGHFFVFAVFYLLDVIGLRVVKCVAADQRNAFLA